MTIPAAMFAPASPVSARIAPLHVAAKPLVCARGVSLKLGARAVIDEVSLTVHVGEIVTVIGPNGAGKTTLGRLMLGLVKPDQGEVTRALNLRVGYVPQRFNIDAAIPLNVARFMTLGRRASKPEIAAALDETGARHLMQSSVATLSGGEFQRVLLARALMSAPDFLVLDEPVQAVDYAGEAQLYDLIAAIRDRRGCGILLISHDLHMVMKASDQVICLNRHICCQGRPHAVANDPAYQKLFGLSGLDALGIYRHRHDHTHDL
ncbi:MAG: metal ABC transporter ATP-binding protein, partial [Hyphomicrobiales bacterium]|nr:metal ABC transporter ATP-binding protein [Hyphomicrobiales bacterium]